MLGGVTTDDIWILIRLTRRFGFDRDGRVRIIDVPITSPNPLFCHRTVFLTQLPQPPFLFLPLAYQETLMEESSTPLLFCKVKLGQRWGFLLRFS